MLPLVSKLILGCMSYGTPEWRPWVLPYEKAVEHIKFAYVHFHPLLAECITHFSMGRSYENGIQTFDTANVGKVPVHVCLLF